MKRLIRRLPPLKALVAFEAVVRLGSVTAAARELGSTQPSVSQHLHALQEDLGVSLFRKVGRSLAPTPQARAYFDTVTETLHRIAETSDRMRVEGTQEQSTLTVRANFGFAHLWLVPRLDALEAAVPGMQLRVEPADGPGEETSGEAGVVVYFGQFARARAGDIPLFEEVVVPVCSPAFAVTHGLDRATGAAALLGLALLHMDEQDPRWLDWSRWFALAGVAGRVRPARIQYRNYPLLLGAAMAGQGLALGWDRLVDGPIAEGRLIAISKPVRRPGWGYILRTRTEPTDPVRELVGALLQCLESP